MDSHKHNEEIKPFPKDVNNSTLSNLINIQRIDNRSLEVAIVTICLTSNHDECNGIYIDSFSRKYLIKCLCKCHIEKSKKEKDKKRDRNSDNVESQKLPNNLCNSTRNNVKPYSSISDDICSCGHNRSSHWNLDQCKDKVCNCSEFLP
ncbi:MAG TPA: hypothetical protein VLA74_09265 [Nitrososphaeraceae archaeon]|nr:hypothetical protein [Nitrososphaeraceae archaeon]